MGCAKGSGIVDFDVMDVLVKGAAEVGGRVLDAEGREGAPERGIRCG